ATTLQNVAASIRVVALPGIPPKGDVSDYLDAGGTALSLLQLAAEASPLQTQAAPRSLARIETNNRQLPDVAGEALDALLAANEPPKLFQRGGLLTRIRSDDDGRPRLEPLNHDALRGHMARAARWVEASVNGDKEIAPPVDVVKDLFAAA